MVVLLEVDAGAELEHGNCKEVLVETEPELGLLVDQLGEELLRKGHVLVGVGSVREGLGWKREEVVCSCQCVRELGEDAGIHECPTTILEAEEEPVLLLGEARVHAEHVIAYTVHEVEAGVNVQEAVV